MKSWTNDIPEIKPLNPVAFLILINSLFFLALLSNSRATRVVLFIPILISSVYVIFYRFIPSDDVTTYALGVQTALRASDAFIINDCTKLKCVGQKEETQQLGIWDRIRWSFDFLFNTRRIGWVDEPRHVLPPHPTESKWQFVRSNIFILMRHIAIVDFTSTVMGYVPLDTSLEHSLYGFCLRMLMTALSALYVWSVMKIGYSALAAIIVGAGLSRASVWSPFFGNWSDAYTVRRFWGRTWHQILRHLVTAHGDFVAYRVLHLRKDSFIGTNVQRYVVFFLSGLIHTAIDYGMLRNNFWEHQTAMKFFLLQATVVMFEQVVGNLLGLKPTKWTRRAGYVWTFLWFTLTFLPQTYPQIKFGPGFRNGIWKTGSMTNFLMTGQWNYEGL